MDQGRLDWIANFIWGIADDVLRDLSVRGKYRDVILYDEESVKTGYEIGFTRYFYWPAPLRTLEEIRADILALEKGCHDAHQRTGVGMVSVFSLLVKRLTGGSSDLATLLGGIGGITRQELAGDSHGGLVETSMLLHLVGAHVDPGYRELPHRSMERDLAERGRPPMQKGERATFLELLRSLPLKQRYYERATYSGAPARASARADSRPMPRVPPVTSATCPISENGLLDMVAKLFDTVSIRQRPPLICRETPYQAARSRRCPCRHR